MSDPFKGCVADQACTGAYEIERLQRENAALREAAKRYGQIVPSDRGALASAAARANLALGAQLDGYPFTRDQINEIREDITKAITEAPARVGGQIGPPRCYATGNLCGTDTTMAPFNCPGTGGWCRNKPQPGGTT